LVRDIQGPAGGSSAIENDASASPWQLYDMRADPHETDDLALKKPEVVGQLSRRYEAWLDQVCKKGFERIAIPVGHVEENPVTLQAHQAYFDGGIHFAVGPGYAHDYLTGWTNRDAHVFFDVDVVAPGEYDAVAIYGCAPKDARSTIRLAAGPSHVEATVVAAEAPLVPLPHRDTAGRKDLVIRNWGRLPLGHIHFNSGRQRLTLSADTLQGKSLMDFKGLELHRLQE
jgi:arylsulfatase A